MCMFIFLSTWLCFLLCFAPAWPVSGPWRTKRRWRGRGGGRWGARAALPTLRMILGHRPATCPPATAGQGHSLFLRPPRCSAGSSHPLHWGVIYCFCATKPKPLFVSSCMLVQTLPTHLIFFGLALRRKEGGILNTFALWECVICILFRCRDINDTMHRNRVWKHQPSGPWSSKSLQRQRGAVEPFIKKPDRPLCWQTLSLPRNKKIYPSCINWWLTHMHTHVHEWICAFTSSDEQVQLDFMEMLRVRDEKRRMRQVEALRRQKEADDEGAAGSIRDDSGRKRGGAGARVDVMEDQEDQGEVFSPPKVAPRPWSPKKAALYSESSSTSSDNFASDRQVRQHHVLPCSCLHA